MTVRANTADWQDTTVEDREALVIKFLGELTNRKVRFECITDLAKMLAEMIASHERVEWEAYLKQLEMGSKAKKPLKKPLGCAHTTLSRNQKYRIHLHAWWANHGDKNGPQQDKAAKEMAIARSELKVATLTKQLNVYKDTIIDLEKKLAEGMDNTVQLPQLTEMPSSGMSNKTAQAFKALHLLIREMESQLQVHNRTLVVAGSLTKRAIIPKDLFEPYLDWLKANEHIPSMDEG
ncbi:MAG: hypothetical protein K6L60_04380 [Oceanobacter sp.]